MAGDPIRSRPLVGRLADRIANGPSRVARMAADLSEAAAMRAVVETPGARISLRVGNRIELFRARSLLDKEPETIAWLDATVGDGSVFYDVGANIGVYTLYAATRHRGVRAVCFEPGAATFARLCANLLDNGVADRAIAFPLMVGNRAGLDALSLSDPRAGAASHARAELGHPGGPVQGSASVRLDDVVAPDGPLDPPTHLKVDVDGPELAVLEGARRVLALATTRHVLVEVPGPDFDVVDRLLADAGLVRSGAGRLIGSGAVTAQNRIYERR